MANDIATVNPRLGIGGNNPPPDLKVGVALRQELEANHVELSARKAALLESAHAFELDHPDGVQDEETSGLLAGIITQLHSFTKSVDKVRQGVKAPYLDGERIIDGFFTGGLVTPAEKRAAILNGQQTAYQRAKADRARRDAEERERQARAEEEVWRREADRAERERLRAEREARRAQDEEAAEAARQRAAAAKKREDEARAEEERARAERQRQAQTAASSAADRSRTRGDYAMASLRTTWKFKVVEIALVPPEFLMVNERLVNAAIRGKDGRRNIPGLSIFAVEDSVNR